MMKSQIQIDTIPAILWGEPGDRLFIAVHGDMSNKEDTPIAILVEEAARQGYQVLSFDLPEHGERKDDAVCEPRQVVDELTKIMSYAHGIANDISLFACSIGAYFAMLAYADEDIKQSLFPSPVVDMKRIIEDMMAASGISAERLRREKQIVAPIKTLDWDYYEYVTAHPVSWDKPTSILYGSEDNLCESEIVSEFAERSGAKLTIMQGGEHWFHTEEQLAFYREWLRNNLEGITK